MDVEEIVSDEAGSADEVDIEEEEEDGYGEDGTEEVDVEEEEVDELRVEDHEVEGEEVHVQEHEKAPEEAAVQVDVQGLSDILGVDVEVLRSLASADQRFTEVLNHCVEALNEKTDVIDQYETTVHQFSEDLSTADQTLRKLVVLQLKSCRCALNRCDIPYTKIIATEMKDSELTTLRDELQERVVALTEAEQTLTSYGEMETEWRNLSEGMEEKVREMNKLLEQRDQEIADHVTQKDQLMAQLQEKGKSSHSTCVSDVFRVQRIQLRMWT